MLLLDVKNKKWSKEMIDICSISEDMLPKLYESYEAVGTIKSELAKELGLKGLNPSRPYFIQFTMNVSEKEFYKIVSEKAAEEIDSMSLVYEKEVPVFEKYDEFVPEELVRKGFAYGVLDIEGMRERVIGWKDKVI